MNPLEAYLQDLSEIHDSGAAVKETSGYPALKQLLAEVGRKLKPKVTPIIHLRNAGAGIPDGGLFTAEQLKPFGEEPERALIQLPARAAIEVKAPSADMDQLAGDKQVADYAAQYGYVLQDGAPSPTMFDEMGRNVNLLHELILCATIKI